MAFQHVLDYDAEMIEEPDAYVDRLDPDVAEGSIAEFCELFPYTVRG